MRIITAEATQVKVEVEVRHDRVRVVGAHQRLLLHEFERSALTQDGKIWTLLLR